MEVDVKIYEYFIYDKGRIQINGGENGLGNK